jgi:predicted DNA-binding transcriptional regulator AlpA
MTFIPPKQYALLTGISVFTVYRWLKDEKIRARLQAERRGPKLWFLPKPEGVRK